jgi:hypothetical protein
MVGTALQSTLPVIGLEPGIFVYTLIAAFGGGAFGAAIGALPAFCFTGFAVIAGEAAGALQIGAESASLGTAGLGGMTGSIGFGMVFGPHVSFAAGAAAAAYAANKEGTGLEQEDGGYHPAKDIAYALGTRPDVLAVGGIFGIIGAVGTLISGGIGLPWDPIAIMVVVSAALHRVAFGYPLIGTPRGSGLLDMSPFENGEEVAADGGAEVSRPATEPWLPHQYEWANVAMIGLAAGLLGGYTAIQTGSPFLAFGISAASLTFLNLGVEKIPVTHHMTLPASTAALGIFGGVPSGTNAVIAIVIAAVFGVYGALAGEVVQRVFYAHSDTHFDPPAAAIVVATFTIFVLAVAGAFESTVWVPTLGML